MVRALGPMVCLKISGGMGRTSLEGSHRGGQKTRVKSQSRVKSYSGCTGVSSHVAMSSASSIHIRSSSPSNSELTPCCPGCCGRHPGRAPSSWPGTALPAASWPAACAAGAPARSGGHESASVAPGQVDEGERRVESGAHLGLHRRVHQHPQRHLAPGRNRIERRESLGSTGTARATHQLQLRLEALLHNGRHLLGRLLLRKGERTGARGIVPSLAAGTHVQTIQTHRVTRHTGVQLGPRAQRLTGDSRNTRVSRLIQNSD